MDGQVKSEIKQEEKKQLPFINIQLTETEQINVSGSIGDEMMAFYLLEKAKDVIKAFNIRRNMEANKIVPAKGGIMNFVKRMKR